VIALASWRAVGGCTLGGMPKITVYLPEEMAEWLRTKPDLNVSALVQQTLTRERILEEQAAQVAEDRAAGLIDEAGVEKWRAAFRKAGRSSSTVAS